MCRNIVANFNISFTQRDLHTRSLYRSLVLTRGEVIIEAISFIFAAQCIAPLGMESGAIPDVDITASSSFDSGNVGPHRAR